MVEKLAQAMQAVDRRNAINQAIADRDKYKEELRKAEKLIREIEKECKSGFVETKEGSKYVHDLINKYLKKE
jgi:hypothetical protein